MSETLHTVPAFFVRALERHGDLEVLWDKAGTVTVRRLTEDAARLAEGLRQAGLERGAHVGFYADNSRRWIVCDMGIQLAGGISVPRGTDTPAKEMAELFDHAGVGLVIAHGAKAAEALEALRAELPDMGEIICMDPKGAEGRTVDDLMALGKDGPSFTELATKSRPEDLATIIYTSGTTGRPKGVMLTQGNFGHQIARAASELRIVPNERFLSILPPWHIFERTVEYVAICSGAGLIYTDVRHFKKDLSKFEPTFVPSVPRLWETVYTGVQDALEKGPPLRRGLFKAALAVALVRSTAWDRARGARFRVHEPHGVAAVVDGVVRVGALVVAALAWPFDRLAHAVVFKRMRKLVGRNLRGGISGGGLMPAHIDRFFRAIELPLLVGYGLTETTAICTLRSPQRNVLGTIGVPILKVEMQIRHPETREPLPPGEVGLIYTRGPHVMPGYYRDEELTRSVLDEEGWFDTGDLGSLTEKGDLCFSGRLKETIVLKGGENIEPTHVETSLLASPLIDQAIVIGQDQKVLAALIVPNAAALCEALKEDECNSLADLAASSEAHALIQRECKTRTKALKGYERINRIALLPEALEPTNGLLTQTLKPRRHVIVERFADLITEAYE